MSREPEPWDFMKEIASRKVNLKTTVHNKTEIRLTFRNLIIKDCSFGTTEMVVPAGEIKRIRSGKFIRKSMYRPFAQKVCVLDDGNGCVLALGIDDFEENEGKELILDMVDGEFQHRFVDPMHKPTISQRIWDAFDPIIVEPIQTLCQKEHAYMQKVTVHNKTGLQLTFVDFYKSQKFTGCYGRRKIRVSALGRTTFTLENFLKDSMNWVEDQYIHVILARGPEELHICPEELLVFNIRDFQDNKGKELILDELDGRLQYYFVDPIPIKWIRSLYMSTNFSFPFIRYGLSVCSFAPLKQAWLRFVSGWKIERVWKGVSSCLFWLAFTLIFFFGLAFA